MRLFVAIQLDDVVKRSLQRLHRDIGALRGVRWIGPEQMHLTLKFLGEVPDGKVDKVTEAVEAAVRGVGGFDLTVGGCGCFPPAGRVRIVWVGVEEKSGALQRTQQACEDACAALGFTRENRPFKPHLTVGRVRDDRSKGAIRTAVESARIGPIGQKVEKIALVQSVLAPTGAYYTTIATYALSG